MGCTMVELQCTRSPKHQQVLLLLWQEKRWLPWHAWNQLYSMCRGQAGTIPSIDRLKHKNTQFWGKNLIFFHHTKNVGVLSSNIDEHNYILCYIVAIVLWYLSSIVCALYCVVWRIFYREEEEEKNLYFIIIFYCRLLRSQFFCASLFVFCTLFYLYLEFRGIRDASKCMKCIGLSV